MPVAEGNRAADIIVFRSMKSFTVLFVFMLAASASAATPPETEVAVLCALHQLHEQATFYSYAHLATAIEQLHPNVLAVELTPADLKGKVEQKNKREYQNSVYPLLRQHPWRTVKLLDTGALLQR